MTVRNDIIDSFRGFSMAMYSTWLWHKPTRSMFDAGEEHEADNGGDAFGCRNFGAEELAAVARRSFVFDRIGGHTKLRLA